MNTSSLRDGLVRTRIPNNVERGWTTASTSFNIRKNKRNVEWLLKQSLNAFKLIQHRFNFHSTCFNVVEWGRRDGFNIAVQQNRTDVVSGPFAQALMNIQNAIEKMGSTPYTTELPPISGWSR